MGAWGEGLYDDDEAMDVKDSIQLLSKMPVPGERIVEILQSQFERTEDLTDDGAPTFWIAIADQFEKKGIKCAIAFELGMEAIFMITVKDFPAFIIVDDKGNDFFAKLLN